MKELVENYTMLKEAKAVFEDKVEKIKEQMKIIEQQLFDKLNDSTQDGAIVNGLKIQIKKKVVYSANDWNAVYAHILNTRDFSLLQARLSSTRLKELEKDGVSVGEFGVNTTELKELSITKATRG